MTDEAFEKKLISIIPYLRRLAARHLYNPQDCADAVQECCYKALLYRDRLNCAECFGRWITRILVNECYTLLRQKAKYALTADVAMLCGQSDAYREGDALREAIALLPQAMRGAVELSLMGYRYGEIARLLCVPESTIKSRMHRAKKTLQTEWTV